MARKITHARHIVTYRCHCRSNAATKKDVLQELARHAARLTGKDEHTIFNVLWEREKLGTTGVGQGLAIPHGRLADFPMCRGFSQVWRSLSRLNPWITRRLI